MTTDTGGDGMAGDDLLAIVGAAANAALSVFFSELAQRMNVVGLRFETLDGAVAQQSALIGESDGEPMAVLLSMQITRDPAVVGPLVSASVEARQSKLDVH